MKTEREFPAALVFDWRSSMTRQFVIVSVLWTMLLFISLYYAIRSARSTGDRLATDAALSNFNKDRAIRSMFSDLGGVYVDATQVTPNPYLPDLPEKDIRTPSGRHLTLVNPAYFIRLAMERYGKDYGIHGRIVSSKPLNPNNAPDPWEKSVLERFEQGQLDRVTEIQTVNGVKHLRLLQPFITEKSCLKCHGHQGYAVGEVRGALGVSVPLAPFLTEVEIVESRLAWTHLLIWLAGMAGLTLFFRRQRTLFGVIEQQSLDLSRATDTALRASQAKSEFLASMSHDIRTPMNAILGLTEVITHTPLNDEQRGLLGRVTAAGRALSSLISDVLDLSQIESGMIQLAETPFSVRNITRETLSIFELRANERDLKLELVCEPVVPDLLLGDEGRYQQILVNLLGNALKFTEKGGVRVKLDHVGETLRLEVLDTGCGIRVDDLEKIFGAFIQVGGTRKRRAGGSGLGLTICRNLARKMGGDVQVESREGEGSVFLVTLRMPRVESGRLLSEQAGEAKPASRCFRKILSVDDSADNRVLIQYALRGLELELVQASSGSEALQKMESQEFDLVLLDIQMPEMDGFEVLSRIRHLEKGKGRKPAIVVALTADTMKEDVARMYAAGFALHMAKPIRLKRLQAFVTGGGS